MNNRMAMGLAVGAGYVLGRTKRARLAFGLTTLVLGRKLAPDGASIVSFVGSRLGDNPQFKDLREQLRTDLRGVGSAAASALVDRRLEAVADRLHDRTLVVQDRLTGLTGRDDDERYEDDESDASDEGGGGGERPARKRPPARKQAAARTGSRRSASSTSKGTSKGTTTRSTKSSERTSGKSTGRPAARRTTKRAAGRGRGGDGDA
ncbi:DNA primase [Streptomyces sp. NBC_01565]|uniref:DNA primase n=1 Tax=unclassified Streptomyces TaxID=2593676 RepID=UPI002256B227|nr:DNA primase [Streptomyces sp. NBC_01565]MCX4547129.1 DNA primase [Streptomyces sp. NBC_01565]